MAIRGKLGNRATVCVESVSLCDRSQPSRVHVTNAATSVLPLFNVGTHVRKRDSIQEMKYKSLLNDSDTV